MRALIQRVQSASVVVDGDTVGAIGPGLLLFAGFSPQDDASVLAWMAKKCAALRIFSDAEGRMNRSVVDVAGGALVVSQFTLYGDCRGGNRPGFSAAASGPVARQLYEDFCEALEKTMGRPPETGRFGADMKVALVNDGPVTLMLERDASPPS